MKAGGKPRHRSDRSVGLAQKQLFCLGSDTEWVRVGIPPSTVAHMIARNLVERDPAGRPQLTDEGRECLSRGFNIERIWLT
jgi:hypothetical protein